MRIRARQMTFGKYPVEEMNTKLYILWGHNPEQSDFPLHVALRENLAKGSKEASSRSNNRRSNPLLRSHLKTPSCGRG
jgi:hypothetical protein